MASKVLMPKLGAQMEEGTIVSWLAEPGEHVEEGDPIVEIQTDKITMEIEAEETGVLLKILYDADTVVPVQEAIAIIGEEGEEVEETEDSAQDISEGEDTSVEDAEESDGSELATEETAGSGAVSTDDKIRRTPAARLLAEEKKIDLSEVKGSGPNGRIHKEDVELAGKTSTVVTPLAKKIASDKDIDLSEISGSGKDGKIYKKDLDLDQGEAASATAKTKPFTGIRKIIAERMVESVHTSPHVTLNAEVEVDEIIKLRQQLLPLIEEAEGFRISYNDILVKVISKALENHPGINIELKGDKIIYHDVINIGVAVAVKDGLLVPVIRDVGAKGFATITRESKDIINKTRNNKITKEELNGSTFTITNIGMYAVDNFNPIINQPNGAILGVGQIVKKPVVVGDEVKIRSVMGLSLSFDHRIIDGAPAAAFLTEIQEILKNPYRLTL